MTGSVGPTVHVDVLRGRALPAAGAVSVVVASSAVSVIAVLGAVRVLHRAAVTPCRSAVGRRPGGRRLVAGFIGAEVVGVVLVARVLPSTGHRDVVPLAVCLVVGVHFVPLARLFPVPIYLRTGVALCAVAAATGPGAVLTGRTELWTLAPGLGAAGALHVTAAVLLRSVAVRHGSPNRRPTCPRCRDA